MEGRGRRKGWREEKKGENGKMGVTSRCFGSLTEACAGTGDWLAGCPLSIT